MTPRILQNALYFPEHDRYLISRHTHDYVTFEYLPGHEAMTDGGCSYLRRSAIPPEHANLVKDWSLDSDSSIELVRERLLWGSLPRDKSPPQFHTYRPIKSLIKDHLQAILDNVPAIAPLHRSVIQHWLANPA